MYNKATRYIFAFILIISVLCSMSSCRDLLTITYTYEELSTDLIKVEIIDYSYYERKVLKTLNAEECDYVITEISNMEFEEFRFFGDPPAGNDERILVFCYPSLELWFYNGVIYKADNKSKTGMRSYYVHTGELEELIDNVLNNRVPLET